MLHNGKIPFKSRPGKGRLPLRGAIVGSPETGLEAPGGFEPPNRGFADLRLSPLGYGAPSHLEGPVRMRRWCRGGDSNSHSLAATAPSTLRVYQFRHLGAGHRAANARTVMRPDLDYIATAQARAGRSETLFRPQAGVPPHPVTFEIDRRKGRWIEHGLQGAPFLDGPSGPNLPSGPGVAQAPAAHRANRESHESQGGFPWTW